MNTMVARFHMNGFALKKRHKDKPRNHENKVKVLAKGAIVDAAAIRKHNAGKDEVHRMVNLSQNMFLDRTHSHHIAYAYLKIWKVSANFQLFGIYSIATPNFAYALSSA